MVYKSTAPRKNFVIGTNAVSPSTGTLSNVSAILGINVGDRALPVNLDLEIANVANTGQEAARFDIFAMCDCIIYIDLAGKVTTRI